jgi:glucokinase
MKYYSGIDLGGTKIYSIVINEEGRILGRAKLKTRHQHGLEAVMERIVKCYLKAIEDASIKEDQIIAIGMGVPSAVNITSGTMLFAPNLNWKNVQIARIMYEKTGKQVFVENDVNIGTYGEYINLNSSKYRFLYGIFVGTGVGGGYIVDGNIIRGPSFTAGEIGHMKIKMKGSRCGCGSRGCLETIAGKVGIIKHMKKLVDRDNISTLMDKLNPDWRNGIGSSSLKTCMNKSDKVVQSALIRSSRALGLAISNLVNTIGIEAVILGGGVIEELGEELLPVIREYMLDNSIADGARNIEIIPSALGDDAVAYGAAMFVAHPDKKQMLLSY